MAGPAVGQIYQVTYQQVLDGQVMENVIHYREITGASTPAQIRTSAELFWTFLTNVQATNVTYTSTIVKQMTPLAFDETITVPPTASGGLSSALANNVVACVLTKRTGTAGKTHRGRMYIGGIASIHWTDPNRLNTAGATAFGTFVGNVMGLYGPSGTDTHLQIGVYSRAIGGSHPFSLAGWQPLTSIDTQIIFGTQRRRRVGVGI
jgi:hypothetical protein